MDAAKEALEKVSKESYTGYRLTKTELIKLAMRKPDFEVGLLWKTGNTQHHIERHHLSDLVLPSEAQFRRGVSHHQRNEYQRAIECYDEAIRIEGLDFRAWHNKIIALWQDGKPEDAIRVADEIIASHPDMPMLWDAKGRILYEIGRALEAGDCLAKAISLAGKMADSFRIDAQMDEWFQQIMNDARHAGKNPETDVELWFAKFAEYFESAKAHDVGRDDDRARVEVGRGIMCLQMAARIGPNHYVMSDDSLAMVLPPGHPALSFASMIRNTEVETLRNYYLKLEKANAEGLRRKK
jgi:tetratricopeptide (TPR) repeat protein